MNYIPEAKKVRDMFASIAGRYDLANSVLSLGIHHLWRKELLGLLRKQPYERGLDLATGTGVLLEPLSRRCKQIIGADFCEPMLEGAKKRVHKLGLHNVECVLADAMSLPFQDQEFDLITVAFGVRNFENLHRGLQECLRVLQSGGDMIVLEFGQPKPGLWAKIYGIYAKYILPLLGGLLTGNRDAYTYLPETSKQFPCGEPFAELLKQIGYHVLQIKELSGGVAYLYFARKN